KFTWTLIARGVSLALKFFRPVKNCRHIYFLKRYEILIVGRRLIRSFLVLLFAVFGSAVAFSVHGDWSPVKYPVAELTETVAYWDQVDAERDAALTAACTADRNGSDCRDLVRDALIAQDRLPGDFILNAGNGYAEAP